MTGKKERDKKDKTGYKKKQTAKKTDHITGS
jgi:hypothetical protein